MNEGRKDDADKVRLDLIPYDVVWGIGEILTFGAKKYSERNWEHGMKWSRCFGAMMRHMVQWFQGHTPTRYSHLFGDLDMETGKSHLLHALCCLMFLAAYEIRGTGTDDRPRPLKSEVN